MDIISQPRSYIDRVIWEAPETPPPRAIRYARIGYVVARDVLEGRLNLRAMSLVYTTLLSIVPLLAISFSVLKGFGVHNQIQVFLGNFLAPLGDKGAEITETAIGFVEKVNISVLGSVGIILLLYTVISLMQKIEHALNEIWHVRSHRSFARRFSDFLSVILVGPVLIFGALGITATILSASLLEEYGLASYFSYLFGWMGRLVPYLLIIAAFTFIYVFVPYTKVSLKSAFVGGTVAGVLWHTAGWFFAAFVVNSANYAAIYSAFATLIVFMIWIYAAWLILLIGAKIAFYHEHSEYVTQQSAPLRLSNLDLERLGLALVLNIARAHWRGEEGYSESRLASLLRMPAGAVSELLDLFCAGKILRLSADTPPLYFPAKPLEKIPVADILNIIRNAGTTAAISRRLSGDPAVDKVAATLGHAIDESWRDTTLKDVVADEES